MLEMVLQNIYVPLQPFLCVKHQILGGLITILLIKGLDSVSKLESSDSELELMAFVWNLQSDGSKPV